MKAFNIILTANLCLITLSGGCAEPIGDSAKVIVRVTDESGSPITNAHVGITFVIHKWSKSEHSGNKGLTDTNGSFSSSGRTDGDVYCSANKAGYYTSRGKVNVLRSEDRRNSSSPNDHQVEMVLRRIGNPVPMYVKNAGASFILPATNTPVAYDLQKADWLPPYGKGQEADLVLTKKIGPNWPTDRNSELKVTFSHPGDGLIALSVPPTSEGSALRSPHEAPLDGYQKEWTLYYRVSKNHPVQWNYDPNRVYVLRLRTVVDERGQVVSANYGKIYEDFPEIVHYFNPDTNNRSLEFDGKRNLLENLESYEKMSAP